MNMKIDWKKELKESIKASLWFMFLTFPIMVMKVSTLHGESGTIYRWKNMIFIGFSFFILSFIWRRMLERRGIEKEKSDRLKTKILDNPFGTKISSFIDILKAKPLIVKLLLASVLIGYPFVFSMYQTNIMISVLIYVILGLGLNIVVGYGGILQIGNAAF
jgi:branched-chain amino acid transport system permease protein